MSSSFQSRWEQVRAGRVRILWLVLGALLMVSALPIGLYHRQVLQLSQNKLVDTERVQQTDLTRSLAQEIQLFESNLTQQLTSERQILALTGLNENVEDPAAEPKVTRLLENFVESNRNTFIYLTAVGKSGKGTSASQGNFRAEQDPFVAKALRRAFETCQQPQVPKYRSDPLALAPESRPAFVVAIPLRDMNENFTGMLAAVVSLDSILHRLQEASVRGRTVFLVDHGGHIVVHPDRKDFVPGADATGNRPVAKVKALPNELRNTETVRFAETEKKHPVEMIGTYSTLSELNWAVIAERSLDQAQTDTGVTDLNRQALAFVSVVILSAILVGYFFAVGISGPIRGLAASTRGIRRGEFHQRSLTPEEFGLMKQHTVKGANIMRPVSQLKEMLPGIELHHEHMDGRGYPYGLQGQQIPLMARIIGVADTLDAMTTNRPYQSAMDLDYAMDRIRALTGSKFDAVVVTALDSAVQHGKLRVRAVEVHV